MYLIVFIPSSKKYSLYFRYIKALEEIKKVEKTQRAKLNIMKTDLPHLKTYWDSAKEKNRDLNVSILQ